MSLVVSLVDCKFVKTDWNDKFNISYQGCKVLTETNVDYLDNKINIVLIRNDKTHPPTHEMVSLEFKCQEFWTAW